MGFWDSGVISYFLLFQLGWCLKTVITVASENPCPGPSRLEVGEIEIGEGVVVAMDWCRRNLACSTTGTPKVRLHQVPP